MDTKIIGIILLVCAGLVFQYGYEDFMDSFFSPEVKLQTTIEKDINSSLVQESKDNKSNVHHVKFVYRSTTALSFLKKHPPQFQTNKEGRIWLEVEVLDLDDNETPGFITQISVFDIQSKNKISEFGQTYYYKDFDKDFKLRITEASPTPEKAEPPKGEPSEKTETKETNNKSSIKESPAIENTGKKEKTDLKDIDQEKPDSKKSNDLKK